MRTRTRFSGAVLALASVIALTGCVGHASDASKPTPHFARLDAAAGAVTPGRVVGTDGKGLALVSVGIGGSHLAGSPYKLNAGPDDDYSLIDQSGRKQPWAAPTPVRQISSVDFSAVGLFVTGVGPDGIPGVFRLDPRTGAVQWSLASTVEDGYALADSFLPDAASGGLIVAEEDTVDTDFTRTFAFVDASTGTPRFRLPMSTVDSTDDTAVSDILSLQPLVTVSGDDRTHAQLRDTRTGKVVKTLGIRDGARVVSTGSAFVMVTGSGKTTALTARDATGRTKWSTKLGALSQLDVVSADATQVLAFEYGKQRAELFDAKTGRLEGGFDVDEDMDDVTEAYLVAPGVIAAYDHDAFGVDRLVPFSLKAGK
jgi:hypothetical protein